MVAKICIILIFVGVVVGVGIYARQHTKNVDGFVLGGRNVGPWLSAFAFGTSYFSAVIFVGYAGLGGVLDWHRQCPSWLVAGVVGARSAYTRDHAAPKGHHHA